MMAAAAVTITEEREEIVDLSDQYYNSRRSLTVNTAETRDITATDQLGQGDVVAVHQPAIETNAGPCSSTRMLIRPPDGFNPRELSAILPRAETAGRRARRSAGSCLASWSCSLAERDTAARGGGRRTPRRAWKAPGRAASASSSLWAVP